MDKNTMDDKDQVYLSVVIPVYNSGLYLEKCFDSVASQMNDQTEIILVDDGSTDGSGDLCDKFHNNFPENVKVIHKENGGQNSARSEGIKLARGIYIWLVDSDDMISDGALKQIIDRVKENAIDLLLFRSNHIDSEDRNIPENKNRQRARFNLMPGQNSKEVIVRQLLVSASLNSLCTKVVKRDLYTEDVFDDNCFSIRTGEDLYITVKLVKNAVNIYYIDEILYMYRKNQNGASNTFHNNDHKTLDIVRPSLYKYMVEAGMETEENIHLFYNLYSKNLCNILIKYIDYDPKIDFGVLREIYEYEFIRRNKRYYKHTDDSLARKIILFMFYHQKWICMIYIIRVREAGKLVLRRAGVLRR